MDKTVYGYIEKRLEFRRRTLKTGKLSFNYQGSVLDCVVRNLSSQGCQVILPGSIDLPHYFTLRLPSSGDRFECEVVWQDFKRAGIKFMSFHR